MAAKAKQSRPAGRRVSEHPAFVAAEGKLGELTRRAQDLEARREEVAAGLRGGFDADALADQLLAGESVEIPQRRSREELREIDQMLQAVSRALLRQREELDRVRAGVADEIVRDSLPAYGEIVRRAADLVRQLGALAEEEFAFRLEVRNAGAEMGPELALPLSWAQVAHRDHFAPPPTACRWLSEAEARYGAGARR
jgi:hypothetical protein